MPAYPHEVAEARRRASRFRWLTSPVRFLGGAPARGGRVPASMSSASPTRAAAAGPSSSRQRVPDPAPTRWSRRSASGRAPSFLGWIDGLELERGRIGVDPRDGPNGEPEVLRRGRRDQRRRDASSRPCATAKVAAAAIDAWLGGVSVREIRWHARAGPGREDRVAAARASRCCARARACRRSRSTGPSAAARRCARTRASTTGRSGGTTRSTEPDVGRRARAVAAARGRRDRRPRADGSCSSTRTSPRSWAARVRRVPASGSPPAQGSWFANLVMVGALAAALGEPPLEAVADAAVELLGRQG